MIAFISKLSGSVYRGIAKPAMFARSPDRVHKRLLRVGAWVGRRGSLRRLLAWSWSYHNPHALAQTLQGVHFTNPVGLSAGFDKNFELPLLLKSIGFGFMEGGSLTHQKCGGNARPWFYRLPRSKSLVVHVGLANDGVDTIMQRLQAYPEQTFTDFPLNISVAKTNCPETAKESHGIADYIGSLRVIKQYSLASLVTLNISCPNAYGGEPFTEPDMLDRLLSEVDKVGLRQPIFIKMPSDLPWSSTDALLAVAARHTVAGVTIGNLTKDRKTAHIQDHLPAHIKGGLSGKPTWELTNNLIRRTYQKYGERFTIIGVGGIFTAQDAYTKIRLGASLVELITGMIYEGPQLIGNINKGLVDLLHRDGYTHISQAIGKDAIR